MPEEGNYFDDDDDDDIDDEGQNEGQSVLWESECILKLLGCTQISKE